MGLFDYTATASENVVLEEITLLLDLSEDDWSRVLKLVETRQFRAGVCATSLTFRSTKMGINTATTTRLIATIIGVGAKIIQTILRRPDPRSAIR